MRQTVKSLRAEAKALKIPRFSKMKKAELIEAIEAHKGYDPVANSEGCYKVAIAAMRDKLQSFRKEVIGDCTLYLGDCREILPLLPKVDAVVTDPPYGIGWKTPVSPRRPKSGAMILGDQQPFDPKPWLEWPCILWGANHFAGGLPSAAGWLIWDKRHNMPPNDQSDCELAFCNVGGSARICRKTWNGGGSLLAENGPERMIHPTQKPVALMRWCLGFVPSARTILDPYMGSGTTGVACVKEGRKFIGIEIDPHHFATVCRRIEEAYKQGDFFISAPKPTKRELQAQQPSMLEAMDFKE